MRRRSLLASASGGNESSFNYEDYMTIEALSDADVYFYNSVETNLEGTGWTETPYQVHIPSGKRLSVRKITLPGDFVGSITVDGQFNLSGNCLSLIFGDDAKNNVDLTGYDNVFASLFEYNSGLIHVSKDFLPATTLAGWCYDSMFSDCTSLVTAPELPATTLAEYCYSYMFSDCTSLVNAPELPATTLADWCYDYMFRSCNSLNYIKMMATNLYLYIEPLHNWVLGVSPTGTFVKNKNAVWDKVGNSGVPSGWSIIKE